MESDKLASINREDIHIIARHSNLKGTEVAKFLKQNVYNDVEEWKKFLRLFLLALGVSFTLAGIIFFFAYNWSSMHRFAKLGMMQGLIVVTTLIMLFSRFSPIVKNILLTGASVLVGVLFAVFGQIYQTGANAYDFFLGWTLFITIWVLLSGFPSLWLIYITLVNTTFILYTQQVVQGWSDAISVTILFLGNAFILTGFILLAKYRKDINLPLWFTNTLALATVSFSTIGICMGIFDFEPAYFILMISAAILYAAGLKYGLDYKRAFYLSIIPFSLIIIISALLIKVFKEELVFLVNSVFIVASVTYLIMKLVSLQKKWAHETGK
jgi:uncharacterized membrane protein